MGITVSGLGSGLDYDSWIEELVAIKQAEIDQVSTEVETLESEEQTLQELEQYYEEFLEAIETFTHALSTEDVFNQRAATSTTEAITAQVDAKTTVQDVSVSVSQLATSTVAESTYTVGAYVDENTTLSDIADGAIKEGTFSVYVDDGENGGQKYTINITSDMSLGDVEDAIDTITGISATIGEDGTLSIEADSGYTISVGASSDTSNFSDVMSLTRDSVSGDYSSSKSIFETSTKGAIINTVFSGSEGDVTVDAGTFYIDGVEFTIDENTSLKDIIDDINSSEAGVTASWNSNTGTLVLTADDEGAVSIDIEAGTSNFTDVMGLTDSGALVTGAQKLGDNAILTINGTEITSSSNTVTSDISGISGLTLTLKDTTSTTETISIEQDITEIEGALTKFVDAYNTVISATDEATASGGELYGETILNSIRNNIRKLVTASVEGEDGYSTLASIGITTGVIGTSVYEDTSKLTLDTDALTAALSDNPSAVKKLLVGDAGSEGVLDKIETVLDNATDYSSGYFITREKSYEKQIGRLNEKIEDMTVDLEDYEEELDAKFSAMDKLIAALEESASIFDYYFNNDNDKK